MDTQRFGLPEKKKFPMPDRQHVFSAIKFFNYATPSEERRLANAIIARMGDYGISWDDVNVGPTNRFRKYIPKRKQEESISHHGIKGQHWGVKNGPPYPLDRQGGVSRKPYDDAKSLDSVKDSVNRIAKEVNKYRDGGPAGNQNCQVCTWAMECQSRGMNTLPRPVYSPRDPVFDMDGVDIVKGATKEKITDSNEVASKVLEAGDGARFYTHVKWDEGSGGHEFITANIKGKAYVIDAQQGVVDPIDGKKGKTYFDGVDFGESFVARMDNKDLNSDTLKMNDSKNVVNWDWDKDAIYMAKNNMLSDSDYVDVRKKLSSEALKEFDQIQTAKERVKEASKTRDAVEDIVKRMSDTDLRMLNQDRGKEYMSVQEGEYLVKRFTKNEKGKPVAFLDLIDGYGDLLNVSVGTDPKHRGKGYAKELTKEAVGWFNTQNDYKILNWSARKENVGSNKVAKESGFKKNYYYSNKDSEWNVYEIKK